MVEMEAQLRQSQKMEAVGMLVGGIAHDFNNLLAGILGNMYLVRKQLNDMPKLAKRIESIEEQGYGAAAMVRQLLSFSRNDMPDCKAIDLVPFTKELAKFAGVSVPEDITFDCQIDHQSLVINCDPVRLQQSLLNLIVNATHAVQERAAHDGEAYHGCITVMVKRAELPASVMQQASWDNATRAQAWVCIRVRDNGTGMDQATMEKVFEPFFTTKPSGSGTGLGLAMVKNYVDLLDGAIVLDSVLGEGSCISAYLPLQADQAAENVEKDISVRPGQGELILLADDDEHVLEALSSMLETANYRVLAAVNGAHAKALFDEHADQLDMAILDMVMPKASGLQAATYMTTSKQHFPVTLMTGYDKEGSLIAGEDDRYPVLRKPWNISNLNSVLSTSLDHTSSATTSIN